MSEKFSKFEHEPNKEHKPNLLENFDQCLDAVEAIEFELSSRHDPRHREILREQMGYALAALTERIQSADSEEKARLRKRTITGFQGIGGFNRYVVRGDGTIGLLQSHSTTPCLRKAEELGIETPEFGFI
jgi:hypothetical protein